MIAAGEREQLPECRKLMLIRSMSSVCSANNERQQPKYSIGELIPHIDSYKVG